jgi:hypothetical protein
MTFCQIPSVSHCVTLHQIRSVTLDGDFLSNSKCVTLEFQVCHTGWLYIKFEVLHWMVTFYLIPSVSHWMTFCQIQSVLHWVTLHQIRSVTLDGDFLSNSKWVTLDDFTSSSECVMGDQIPSVTLDDFPSNYNFLILKTEFILSPAGLFLYFILPKLCICISC